MKQFEQTNYSVGDTINMEYVDPAPKNAYYLYEHVSMGASQYAYMYLPCSRPVVSPRMQCSIMECNSKR